MAKYELSENDVKGLLSTIDLAVKNGGLQVAEAGLILARKLQSPIIETAENVIPITPKIEGENK